ncbi:MAG: hypothetical protein FWF08_04740, partial [Oscillospiraceae bacterium]|nr:hypothetical protein [Oscillospiraceae bacterium]
MKTELHDYDICPLVFEKGQEIVITINPRGAHAAFSTSREYRVMVCGFEDGAPGNYPKRSTFKDYEVKICDDGCIRFKHFFKTEQQYYIRVFDDTETSKELCELEVYAVADDLTGRYPYLGDLHIHTSRSDGKQSPAV